MKFCMKSGKEENIMKKLLALALVAGMVFSMTACGSNNADTTDQGNASAGADSTSAEAETTTDDSESDLAYIKDKGQVFITYAKRDDRFKNNFIYTTSDMEE